MHSLLQIKDDKDSQIRFFASFVLQIERIMKKMGVPVSSQPTAWQRQVDRMAEQCDLIEDSKSIIVKEYYDDSEVEADYGVHIQPRMYNTEKIDNYLEEQNSEIVKEVGIEEEFKSYKIDDIKGES